ncbi:MAG: TetR/AcrR family transcriptional regulator [Methylotenera sp.]|nr:TetR/AcrR family transcriptional regulator [Methylotenera sp.]
MKLTDKTYQDITDALDLLATGNAHKTNGKISAVNLAREASISKATLYRYFSAHENLKHDFITLKKNGINTTNAPETVHQENILLRAEIKNLRSKLFDQEQEFSDLNSQKSHNIVILWREIERLKIECNRYLRLLESYDTVSVFPGNTST